MAAEATAAVANEAVGKCVNKIKHHFNYLKQYHDNMKNLRTNLQKLKMRRDEVKVKVTNATDNSETIKPDVRNWLEDVDRENEEAEDILKDEKIIGNGCWRRWFVNFNLRYRLSRKAMKKSAALDTLLNGYVFEIVAYPKAPLARVTSEEGSTSEMPAAGADGGLASRSAILNDVMVAVKDPKIHISRKAMKKSVDLYNFLKRGMFEFVADPKPPLAQVTSEEGSTSEMPAAGVHVMAAVKDPKIHIIKHHFNYLSQYHDNMMNLRTNLQNLQSKRDEVQVKVIRATNNCETIFPQVNVWLREVDREKSEAEEILNDEGIIGNGCWRRWFVNFNLRYRLSRKAMKKSAALDTLLKRCVFKIVADEPPLAQVTSEEGSTSEMPVGLASRSAIVNDVMAAVKDPKIHIIRIWGMGGIGKTTIAKQVKRRARAEHLFHEIAFVEVNQNPDLRTLQRHIAELLDLELKEDSVPARAMRLCQRLNAKDENGQNKRILLILDNVWQTEGLKEAGIPLTDEKSLCKILLTSRSDRVCKGIAPEREFNICFLSLPESLILFRERIPNDSFYDQKMAEDLVKKCGGLPISITAIAGAVTYGEKEIWADALRKLQKSEFEGEYGQVLNSLKVSYDFLENEEIKRFFRLFCFFRKGSVVPIEDLVRYGMALGYFTNPENLDEARNEAHLYADKLLHSNLLLRGDKEGCFKVHDIVWDFSAHAPSNDLFIINHGDALIKSKRREPNQNYTSISLQCSEMVKVLEGVDFQNLKFLQLLGKSNTFPLKFPNIFFEEMKELNVLAFRSLKVTSLPKSLQCLNNLLSLSFDRCSIGGDISMIGNLVKLELLSFAYSDIEELPLQIANLKALRLLDMTGCKRLCVIAQDVLSQLSSLEELYMRGTPLQLRSGSPTLFSEMASMSKLVAIDILMPAAGVDEGLTSRSAILNDVMAAVKDPKIRIIRICGMGGIGKTTIAKEVERRARAEHLFHEIAMLEVNQKPDIETLQCHIANHFGLKLEVVDVPARAKRLCKRLNAKYDNGVNKKKNDQNGENKGILLILDNVWEEKDLEKVGIPLTEEKSLCKILLTSRSDRVCMGIAPEREFNIGFLSLPESLILFRERIPNESFYDQKMAEALVKKCGGLPISITAIAADVANKPEVSWKNALGKLRKTVFCGENRQVLNSLKVSYDFLENEEIKRFFRLFCFFRKGSDVLIEDLARYGMALGCFTDHDKLYDARIEAHSYADTLLHSSLLLRGDKVGCFKVHDIVWDLAVQVPSNDLFFINHGDELIKSKRREPNQNYTSISLQCSEMVEVPKGEDFWNLKFLQLIGNSDTLPLKFPNNFFEEMNKLNVLAFRSLEVKPLPESLQRLNNLLSLSFDRCYIGGDISMIGNLVKLELLSFAYSDIEELPLQIANLKALRLLDMTGCKRLGVIGQDVLSKLSSLEELYMRGTPLQLRSGSPTLFSEIASMSNLVVIDIVMPVEVLPMDVLFAKLKHFKISVTSERDRFAAAFTTSQRREEDGYLLENYLDLECDSTVLQQRGVKLLLQETVRMDLKVTNLNNFFPLYNSEEVNFSKLQKLSIESCNEMVYLVKMMGHLDQNNVFQNLVSLRLYKLPGLVDIFHVSDSSQSFVVPFCNLKVLNVESCDELEHLFSSSDARSLNRLEDVTIISCEKLKVVFGKGRRGEVKVELCKLKKMTLEYLPNLVGFCSDVEALEFPQLEELKIDDLPLITSIIHKEIGPFDSSQRDDSSSQPLFSYKSSDRTSPALVTLQGIVRLPSIQKISVANCTSLQYVFSSSTATSMEQLIELRVEGCRMLMEVIRKDEEEVDERIKVVFHSLTDLILERLPNLEGICLGRLSFDWPLLRSLNIRNCLKMRIFTSRDSTTPVLEYLCVNGKSYNPMMEEGDVNTVLRNVHINAAKDLALKDEGTLMITDFHLAGEHLVAHYSTWSWESSCLDDDIVEQYLIARNVPCLTKPRKTTSKVMETDEFNKYEVGDEDGMNIYKPRTYDVSITYDHSYKSTRFWLKGYDESNMDLPLDLVFQDINMKYLEESHVTRRKHPYESGRHISLFPPEKSRSIAKVLFNHLLERGFNTTVQNHLQLFVDELFPTFQFGPAP